MADLQRLLRIDRYDPETHERPKSHDYLVPQSKTTTVLDALISVQEQHDSSLGIRHSCRSGVCGACGVQVNGTPVLACRTRIHSIENDDSPIEVAPLANHPVICDLITDFDPTFLKLASTYPWIQNDEASPGTGIDSDMTQDEINRLGRSQACLSCGLCDAIVAPGDCSEEFIGPATLVREFRFAADVRDGSDRARLERVTADDGIWACEPDESWNRVCPVGIDPASKVRLLREAAHANDLGVSHIRT